jgi:hypothetical protein
MPSENYRYYRLDERGGLHRAKEFSAGSDQDAIAVIRAKHPGSKCEIWEGNRLVSAIGPTSS